jgi:hypothetical protein
MFRNPVCAKSWFFEQKASSQPAISPSVSLVKQ